MCTRSPRITTTLRIVCTHVSKFAINKDDTVLTETQTQGNYLWGHSLVYLLGKLQLCKENRTTANK